MMSKFIPLFAAALLSTAAMANDDKMANEDKAMHSADATFKALDRDADARLSQTEAAGDKKVSQHFASLDADADGYLSMREYSAHAKMEKDKMGKDY